MYFMDEKYSALFTPWKIGNVEIPNRIVQCSMGGTSLFGWLEPCHFDKEAANFLLTRAKDGVGLVLPGMQCVRDTMGRRWLYQNKKMFKELADYMVEYHKTGSKLFIQLAAGFGRSMAVAPWMVTLNNNKLLGALARPVIDLEISDYYKPSLERRMFRPPFIQFYECNNVLIENVKIVNSPFWTINPAFCDNVTVHGVTIYNPSKDPKGPNTDGINPSSCRNVRISDCFISVGDDCITIKSGRDADGRKYGKACENITITNCVMLSGHGGVVIGSEMSGGVRRVTISNCVFDGTDSGIRLKSSRGRGGVVEELRVDNIVMKNIQRNAFIFDLFYDKESKVEPVSERTPVFRNIHLSNITGSDIKQIGYIKGIEEMPVQGLSFSNINMKAEVGFIVDIAEDIRFDNVDFSSQTGSPWQFSKCKQIVLNNVRSKYPVNQHPIVTFEDVDNAIINNCFQMTPVKDFYKANNSHIIEGHNYWKKESFK